MRALMHTETNRLLDRCVRPDDKGPRHDEFSVQCSAAQNRINNKQA